ncbi:MAG: hypothetical protein LBT66_01545 [Methanobrevibacter sp.]|jgi:hypothetical protein|nr:hypothetical protein [Candidatus Methanovirga meridionalis]
MAMNQLEFNLQEITNTIAYLENSGCKDENLLNGLKQERDSLLKKLNVDF